MIERDGLHIVSELDGPADADVVTLAHAQVLDRTSWDPTVAALVERYRVLRLDLRGHGESSVPHSELTIEDLADDVLAVLDAHGLDRTHFVGSSLGGMIGFSLALDHPERLHSVTFTATQGVLPVASHERLRANAEALRQSGETMDLLADTILERFMVDGFADTDPDGYERTRDQVAATSVEGYVRTSLAIIAMNYDDRLEHLSVPTMVIAGELDRATPPERMQLYRDRIPGARMAIIDGAGHFPFIDQPAAYNAALAGFLDGLEV